MAKNVTVQRIVSVLLHRAKFIILATVVMFRITVLLSVITQILRLRLRQKLKVIQKRLQTKKIRRFILPIFPHLQTLLKSVLRSLKILMR